MSTGEGSSSMPRLLVTSYFGPGWPSGGAVIVDGLLRDYPCDAYARFHVALRLATDPDPRRRGQALHVPGLLHPRWRRLASRLLWDVGSRLQVRQAEAIVREFAPDVVWSVLDYLWVPFTFRFMQRTRLPVHVSVHDDPVASAQLAGWPASMLRRLERAFGFCYREAASRDVISEGMRHHYATNHARDAVIVTHGIDDSECRAITVPSPRRPLRIVHVGNLHYPEEAIRFAEAVQAHGTAELTLIGNPPASVRAAAHRLGIRIVSWVSQAQLDVMLAEFDFAYLPYGFSPARRLFVETSFPTKLITYVKAGLPVLHHGPANSSVAAFLRRYRVGVLLDTMDRDALRAALPNGDPAAYAALRAECARAVREVFAHEAVFERWLGEVRRGAIDASAAVAHA